MTPALVSSGARTPGDIHRWIARLIALSADQMATQSREGVFSTAELERLGLELFGIAQSLDLQNANCFSNNMPAVDLLTRDRSLGIQITLGLTAKKARETQRKFKELTAPGRILAGTSRLWILGLDKTPPAAPRWRRDANVEIGDFSSQLNLANLDIARLLEVERVLLDVTGCIMSQSPDVQTSLQRIVDFLDRPAVYLYSAQERSWAECLSALDGVTLLINTGLQRTDRSTPAREWTLPLSDMPPEVRAGLKGILRQINAVTVAVHQAVSTTGNTAAPSNLGSADSQLIDAERAKLRTLVNNFSRGNGIMAPFPETEFS